MGFKAYIEQLKQRVSDFERYWIDQAKANPKHFPMEMPNPEWDDQWQSYSEFVDGRGT